MAKRATPRAPFLPPPPPPPPNPLIVRLDKGVRQGAILGLVDLGLGPRLGIVGALVLVSLPPGRT